MMVQEDITAYCSGHHDMWACEEDYSTHQVPREKFGSSLTSPTGLQPRCLLCTDMRNKIISMVEKYIPQRVRREHPDRKEMHAFAVEVFKGKKIEQELKEFIQRKVKNELLSTAPAKEYFDWVDSQKESVIRLVTSPIKSRDKTQYDKLKELYNYTCQVESCHETEVEFAHILKHSLPNSVDNPTNGWCICRNHHKAYDSNRMIVEMNGDFVRYDVHGNIIERHGRIIYNDLHKVNPMFITLAREHHDREK